LSRLVAAASESNRVDSVNSDNSNKIVLPCVAAAESLSKESNCCPRIHRDVVLVAAARQSGLRWLTALLDSYPRSVCRSDPFDGAYSIGMESILRRLRRTGFLTVAERDCLVEEWSRNNLQQLPALFFSKAFVRTGHLRQWWSWARARWSDRARSSFVASTSPGYDQPFDLVLTQTNNDERMAQVASGLQARVVVLRRHPGAVVASQLRGLRRGQLPPVDRVGWFEENRRACRQLELRLSSVLRMPIADLLAYQWLVQNMQFRSALAQLSRPGLAMQFEDFCHDPSARAKELFAYLGWEFGAQTQALIRHNTGGSWHSLHGWLAGRRRYATMLLHASNNCEAWRDELTDYEQRRILGIAGAFPNFKRYWPE
jgi:hypothetical protein